MKRAASENVQKLRQRAQQTTYIQPTGPPVFVDEEEEQDYWEQIRLERDAENRAANGPEPMDTLDPDYSSAWCRQDAPPLQCETDDLVFMHTDTSYYIDENAREPVIRLFGDTEGGQSVVAEVRGFRPYFYTYIPDHLSPESVFHKLNQYLGTVVAKRDKVRQYVLCWERVFKETIMGYKRKAGLKQFYKVTMAYPVHVKKARKALDYANVDVTNGTICPTYEASIPFALRFMVDKNMGGCQWLKIPAGLYSTTDTFRKKSRCQYEVVCEHGCVNPITDKDSIAPLRVLSFDIEALRRKPGFPNPEEDSVITICCALEDLTKGIIDKVAFTTGGGCKSIEGVRVIVCDNERDLLLQFRKYVLECDPTIFTGYNIDGFDFPYLRGCAKRLKCLDAFSDMTRVHERPAYLKSSKFESKAHGARKSYEWVCEGRFSYDCLIFMLRGQMKKLRSYKLNAVAKYFLGDEKVDVTYDQIPILYDGTDDDRARLAWYCSKDAILPLDLLRQQMAFVNGIEQGRITGVPIKWLMSRGQQIKTMSNLLRYKDPSQCVPTESAEQNAEFTAGGHVEEPIRGYYDVPIATLDFASLYPSIICAYNICYSTKESLVHAFYNMKEEDYNVPAMFMDNIEKARAQKKAGKKVDNKLLFGFCFVKRHVKEGILPKMLRDLLQARKNVKGLMKEAGKKVDLCKKILKGEAETPDEWKGKDIKAIQKEWEVKHSVFNGRQLAIKIVCNSVYGFLKANMVCDRDLMSAVTDWGRWMIGVSKHVAETHFTKANGYEFDAYVVYGDTDSIMVNFGDVSLARCIELAKECSAMCTKKFKKPNLLEFETIKIRSSFINKKRYWAIEIEYLKPGETKEEAIARTKYITYKGLESKRRDNAKIGSGTQAKAIEMIARYGDIEGAANYVKSVIADINMGRVDMSQFVITKGLSKTEKQYEMGGTKQQHVELAKRIKARSSITGEMTPSTGDRVPYVMTCGVAKKSGAGSQKAYELAEDPLFALRNAVPIDTEYYIRKQVMQYCLRVFVAIWEPKRCKEITSTITDKTASAEKKLRSFKTYQRLFTGKHMRAKVQRTRVGVGFGISRFAKKLPQCLGCGTPIKPGSSSSKAVCRQCYPQFSIIYSNLQEQRNLKQAEYTTAWTECQRCQGSFHKKVTCGNRDCGNFYRRESVIMDLEDLDRKINLF